MAYNQSTITRILDPIIDVNNNRVTWHLPQSTILSPDIKMLNIGAVLDAGAARKYNRFAGGLSLIKNIYLTSNGVTIDQLLDANSWIAFNEANKSHSEAESLSRNLIGNSMGLILDDNSRIGHAIATKPFSTSLALSGKCMISLGDLLPFLKASTMVPTTIYENLRLTIEYDTSMTIVGNVNTSTLTAMSTPFLVVEEMLDLGFISKATSDYRGLGFMAIERDQMHVDTTIATLSGVDNNEPNTFSLQSRAFQNKYVSRIVVAPKSTDADAYKYSTTFVAGGGGLGSIALLEPKFNIVVNGSNKIAGQGLVGSTEIAARLHDTWGISNTPTGAYSTGVFDGASFYAAEKHFVGYMGWMGMTINEFVQSLYVNIDFTAQLDASASAGTAADVLYQRMNSKYNLVAFAECRKSIVVRPDGSFMVSYM
tara:strand:+ start:3150 stop:4424 length:1275 start_codon:yes stop_codon:yes gene_type:complete